MNEVVWVFAGSLGALRLGLFVLGCELPGRALWGQPWLPGVSVRQALGLGWVATMRVS